MVRLTDKDKNKDKDKDKDKDKLDNIRNFCDVFINLRLKTGIVQRFTLVTDVKIVSPRRT